MKSPWNEPVVFKKVPEKNPKTNEPVMFYMCSLCGAVVVNRRIHEQWHDSIQK